GIEYEEAGHAVRRRRGVADIAGERAGVLDLDAADLARRQLETGEPGRQVGGDELAPAQSRADAVTSVVLAYAAQGGERGDVENVLGEWLADPGGVEIGAAGKDGERSRGERRDGFPDLAWAEVDAHPCSRICRRRLFVYVLV